MPFGRAASGGYLVGKFFNPSRKMKVSIVVVLTVLIVVAGKKNSDPPVTPPPVIPPPTLHNFTISLVDTGTNAATI